MTPLPIPRHPGARRFGLAATVFIAAVLARGQPRAAWFATPQEAETQSAAAMAALGPYLNAAGFAQLEQRTAALRAVTSRAAAERRQAEVRAKIVALVGGIPKATGPVDVRAFGVVEDAGFTVERIAFASCPDYWVTANVYVPPGKGPFPAVVMTVGHGGGKNQLYSWGATLARSGVLVLAYDPMGQGERLQHYDPELGDSKVERMGEHEHANQAALLVGQPIARYWFADGMRAVDYLVQRRDVDPARIGTFGCSGGGTAAAYLAAMDPRVSVAAVSSFITSFRELLPGNGPQDAEQTLPGFLAAGLDFADWVELAAPRAYAVVAYEQDFFPIAGAVATFNEAQGFYAHFAAAGRVELIRGPGGHCNLPAVMPQLLGFLFRHLQGSGARVPEFEDLRLRDADGLTVTATGQVSTSLGGRTVEDFVRDHPAVRAPAPVGATRGEVDALRARLRDDIHAVAGTALVPGSPLAVRRSPLAAADTYRIEKIEIDSEPGITLTGRLAMPLAGGSHPVVLWMDNLPPDKSIASPDFTRLAAAGNIVLAVQPRGVLGEPPPNPALALGQYQSPSLRALIVGKTLVGMRVDDVRRTVAWLAALPGADPAHLLVYGRGAQGMVALHAAVLDARITAVATENALVSYRLAVRSGLHRNLSELAMPGVLTRYDTGDLLLALSPRPVTVLNPANALGQVMRLNEARAVWAPVLAVARELGEADRIRLLRRDPRDVLPVGETAAGMAATR